MTSLRYFEAAARLESFSAAALELHTSKGVMSYHVQALERFLHKPLFIRRNRAVFLTEHGRQFQSVVAFALSQITAVAASISAGARSDSVVVHVGPYFSAQWLSPRLAKFRRLHPHIEVQLIHATSRRVEESAQVDLSIRWGTGSWRGCDSQLLLPVENLPVCSPAYKRQHPELKQQIETESPAVRLLHYDGHDAWAEWYRGMGLRAPANARRLLFDEPNVLNAAVVAGQGVAIGFLPLVARDLRSQRLVVAHPGRIPSEYGYYLVRKQRKKWSHAAEQFAQWVKQCVGVTQVKRNGVRNQSLPNPSRQPKAASPKQSQPRKS